MTANEHDTPPGTPLGTPLGTPGDRRRADDALLRDALVSLERSRQKETRARAAAETLVSAMHRLVQAASVEEISDGVLSAFLDVVGAKEAAVLARDDAGRLQAVAQTFDGPPLVSEQPDGPMLRATLGKSALIGDLSRVSGWTSMRGLPSETMQSALLMPMPIKDGRALLLGLHPDRNRFGRDELSAARAFAPVASEAYLRAQQIEAIDRLVARLDVMANHDALTGLNNRQRFLDALLAIDALPAGDRERYALLHLDLDGFKAINDSLGHAAGDAILQETARRLIAATQDQDLCARLGGDEFSVKFKLTDDGEDPAPRAEALLEAVSRPILFEGQALSVGASIGLAIVPDDSSDSEGALRASDVALVAAKTAGRGRLVRFETAMNRRLARRRHIEALLQRAIERDEFSLHYQPIFCSSECAVTGFEALIRWNNSSLGPLAPPEYLRIAADCGLMPKIGEWVTRRACEEAGPWLQQKPGRRLAINVASAQLVAPHFVNEVRSIVEEAGLTPAMIELELSEEIVIQRTAETALDNLMALHGAGFQIAFDDFGTGYSSLQHLLRFPGQRLKIDRSFVMNIDTRPGDLRLVRGLADLASALDLEVVAEGVETPAQLRCCIAAGCEELQGYVLARPQPFQEALAGLKDVEHAAREMMTDRADDAAQAHAS